MENDLLWEEVDEALAEDPDQYTGIIRLIFNYYTDEETRYFDIPPEDELPSDGIEEIIAARLAAELATHRLALSVFPQIKVEHDENGKISKVGVRYKTRPLVDEWTDDAQ